MEDARLEFQGCDKQHIDVLVTKSGIDIEMESDFETNRMFLYWKEWDKIEKLVKEYKEVKSKMIRLCPKCNVPMIEEETAASKVFICTECGALLVEPKLVNGAKLVKQKEDEQ